MKFNYTAKIHSDKQIHLRTTGEISKFANQYEAYIALRKVSDGKILLVANAKSILEVLLFAGANKGDLEIAISGVNIDKTRHKADSVIYSEISQKFEEILENYGM